MRHIHVSLLYLRRLDSLLHHLRLNLRDAPYNFPRLSLRHVTNHFLGLNLPPSDFGAISRSPSVKTGYWVGGKVTMFFAGMAARQW